MAKLYTEALQSGNPNTIVAYNNGVRFHDCRFEYESYSCGETCHPYFLEETSFLTYSADDRWTENGYQHHLLTFLGENWGLGGTLYDTDELAKHTYENFLKQGAALSFDVAISADGTVVPEHMEQLKAIYQYASSKPAYELEPLPEVTETEPEVEDTSVSKPATENTKVEKKVEIINRNGLLFWALGAECVVAAAAVVVVLVIKKKKKA